MLVLLLLNLAIPPAEAAEVRLAVAPLQDGSSDSASAQLAVAVRDALEQLGHTVVPQSAMQAVVQYHQPHTVASAAAGADDVAGRLQAQLAQAKQAFLHFQNGPAESSIASLESQFHKTPDLLATNGRTLADGLMLRALMAQANNNGVALQSALGALQRVAPNFSVRTPEYPPSLVQGWDRMRQGQTTGTLAVASEPAAADVLINGIPSGTTPLTGLSLPVGTYHIAVVAHRYAPVVRTVQIAPNATEQIRAKLAWKKSGAPQSQETTVDAGDAAQIAAAQRIGQLTHSQRVVLVNVDEAARDRGTVTARMVDTELGVSLAPQVIHYGADRRQLHARLADLAQRLGKLARVNMQQHPGRAVEPLAAGAPEYLAQRERVRRDHRVRPVVWAVLGTVVAGGVIGGVLAATGGGSGATTGGLTIHF